jgi:hypothetical protein
MTDENIQASLPQTTAPDAGATSPGLAPSQEPAPPVPPANDARAAADSVTASPLPPIPPIPPAGVGASPGQQTDFNPIANLRKVFLGVLGILTAFVAIAVIFYVGSRIGMIPPSQTPPLSFPALIALVMAVFFVLAGAIKPATFLRFMSGSLLAINRFIESIAKQIPPTPPLPPPQDPPAPSPPPPPAPLQN